MFVAKAFFASHFVMLVVGNSFQYKNVTYILFLIYNMSPMTPFGGSSVILWAVIYLGALTALYIVKKGTLKAEGNEKDFLQSYAVLIAPFIGVHVLLLHDIATPHTTQVFQCCTYNM